MPREQLLRAPVDCVVSKEDMAGDDKVTLVRKGTSGTATKQSDIFAFGDFPSRHLGIDEPSQALMLKTLGLGSMDELIKKSVPAEIRLKDALELPAALNEHEMLRELTARAQENVVCRSYLGLGYHNTVTPTVIARGILENPGWYTQYTPYQAEIAQGRLEALLNFQTMVCDLTGMQLANASMLDEGTAAAEAMTVCCRQTRDETKRQFFVAQGVLPQTKDILKTRALPLDIEIVEGDYSTFDFAPTFFGALLQYPEEDGRVCVFDNFAKKAQDAGIMVVVAADILSLALLKPPGEWGADIVVGNTQRFGVPMGFGGPHAAYFACRESFKRQLPGRLVGVSKDSSGRAAYRLALQVREQHIKREKATSNICTAQVLLAIIASMYAVYHGPKGIKRIAERVHRMTALLKIGLEQLGFSCRHQHFFDTVRVEAEVSAIQGIMTRAEARGINLRGFDDASLGVALDETVTLQDVQDLLEVFSSTGEIDFSLEELAGESTSAIEAASERKSEFLTHAVFNSYHTETEFLRYINRLQSRDLSLATAMIPLGSCTMKLNATTEMLGLSMPEFAAIHPFAPASQTTGYAAIVRELETALSRITGFAATSVQPNAGSQGEYAGLLVIDAFHKSKGDTERDVCLIPQSAHGTNPASAMMAGMKVVVVKCDEDGNVDVADLRAKASEHKAKLAALMITYPSTHGVFETHVKEVCQIIHEHGGQVYMDGANLNAQVGLTSPGEIGADVCHINLHKTFCIPHGGGGPGVGPIAVAAHLEPFLPGHVFADVGGDQAVGAVSAAPWGSALILLISWSYIRMMGADGLTKATEIAILNANYVAKRLNQHFPILYRGKEGFVGHECILDLRRLKREVGITVEDVAKRLMDYGFHAPTVSFPVAETLMVEPTESECKAELDRFCDAMIAIAKEISAVENGEIAANDSVLRHAPHTAEICSATAWDRKYSREEAAYPVESLRAFKFWPAVGRIDAAYGDRNLFCSCVPLEELS